MELVNQIDNKTCGAACVAMVTGQDIKTVIDVMRSYNQYAPYSELDLFKCLVHFGYLPIKESQFDDLQKGKVYIASVASLNVQGGMHYIVIDTTEEDNMVDRRKGVYDPQNGRLDKKYYGVGGERLECWSGAITCIKVRK